jgi:hypothetical protein
MPSIFTVQQESGVYHQTYAGRFPSCTVYGVWNNPWQSFNLDHYLVGLLAELRW